MSSEYEVSTSQVILKAGPAIAGASYSFSELPWSQLAAAATFVYVVLQIYFLLKSKWVARKRRRQAAAFFARKYQRRDIP